MKSQFEYYVVFFKLKLARHYFILDVYLLQRPDDGLIN